MVTVTMQLELPDIVAAQHMHHGARELCDQRGDMRLVSFQIEGVPACPECGGPTHYNEELQTHVCAHDE